MRCLASLTALSALAILCGCGIAATSHDAPDSGAPPAAIAAHQRELQRSAQPQTSEAVQSQSPTGTPDALAMSISPLAENADHRGLSEADLRAMGLSNTFLMMLDQSGPNVEIHGTCEEQQNDKDVLDRFCAEPAGEGVTYAINNFLICPAPELQVSMCNWQTARSPTTEPIWSFVEGFAEGIRERVPVKQVAQGAPLTSAPFAAFFYSDLYDDSPMPRYSTEVYFLSEMLDAPNGNRIGWLHLQGHSGNWPEIDGATLMFWFPGEADVPTLSVNRHPLGGWDPIAVFDKSQDEAWLRVTSMDQRPIWISSQALDCCGTFKLRLTVNSALAVD